MPCRQTHTQLAKACSPAQVPALSLLTKDPRVGGAPLCSPQRHLVTEPRTAGSAGLWLAARVNPALPALGRYLLNLNIVKISEKNWSLFRMLFHGLSWLSAGGSVVRKHCSAWGRYSLIVPCICPKCLDSGFRVVLAVGNQGNLQKISQIAVFLWAGMNHGALNCWAKGRD